jgi:integrase
MAWLEQHPTSGRFKICFRWGGKKFKKTVKTTSLSDAEIALARFNENLNLLERGRMELPPGADIGTFLLSDGKLNGQPTASPPTLLTLGDLRDAYVEVHSNGAMEENSLATVCMHLRHIIGTLGKSFWMASLKSSDLQRQIDRRARKRYRGSPLSAVTLRKEMASFRACWNWGMGAGQLYEMFPGRGLKYPKTDEKPPFQTRAEIERQIARGGLAGTEIRRLWDSLFLTRPEIARLLEHVRLSPAQSFLHPMVCLVAHTGARRSELLRLRIDDVDFGSGTVLIHEKKRARGRRTSRRVPLPAFVQTVLRDWLATHPGGQHLFCQAGVVRSKTPQEEPVAVTRDEAHDHFRRALAGSCWAVLRGWHVLRHSFASNCAAAGIDQRMINEWMGHQTEEMVRRYRHLFPDQQRRFLQLFSSSSIVRIPPAFEGQCRKDLPNGRRSIDSMSAIGRPIASRHNKLRLPPAAGS